MSQQQFIFICTNPGNEILLKEEVKNFYPEFTFSFSKKGFVTFKNTGVVYDLKTISQLQLTFATRCGIFYGKSKPETIVEDVKSSGLDIDNFMIHSFAIGCETDFDAEAAFGREVNAYSAEGKTVIDLISLGPDEIWFGAHSVASGCTRYPNSMVEVDVPENTVSKGYLKLAQIVKLYAVKLFKGDLWLDFGCAPGGASQFLLNEGCKVVGIDPAKIDPSLANNKNFSHIKRSVQDLSHEDLPEEVRWIHADININPKQSIKEVLRLAKKYNRTLKGVIFTVQVVKMEYIENIESFEDQFYDWGFNNIISRQVPSHKKEYIILATR
ncbi:MULTISPECIES: SAM-dependent methyltransferase [unclassified Halobacteriovorax]|uniref:SAM-dependent methyltransferase n=1 Tax=unclassified Halobacteriovorax TaxID=2639665 RepID=UPI0039994AB2